MAATVDVEVWTGGSSGSPNKSTASTLRFRSDDSPTTIDSSNPCVIPDSGTNYSYWVHVALALSGTYTEVSNIRHYTDGTIGWSLGTGGQVVRGNQDSGDHGCPEGSYEPATGNQGTTGDDLASNHAYYSGETTSVMDITGDTDTSPATIDSSSYGPDASASTQAVVLQIQIDTDATQGTQSSETFTFVYDEI